MQHICELTNRYEEQGVAKGLGSNGSCEQVHLAQLIFREYYVFITLMLHVIEHDLDDY